MATTKITSRSLETGAALANLNAGASVALTVPVTATNYNPGTNVATFLATPTSANLLAAVTDETGSGSLVFAASPTLSGVTITGTSIVLTAGTDPAVIAVGTPTTTGAFVGGYYTSGGNSSTIYFGQNSYFNGSAFVQPNTSATSSTMLIQANSFIFYTQSAGNATNSIGTIRVRITAAGMAIGSSAPNAKAALDMQSTTQGFLPPRMDTTQRNAIASPPAGLVIYNTTTSNLNSYSGSAWVELVDSADLGANVATFLATPTSANLASALTDENGTGGGFVRAEGATLTSPSIAGTASFTDATRPTSAGTGTPAATSLMTRDDVALEPFYSLGSVFRVSATPAFATSGTGSAAATQGAGDRWVTLSSGTANSGWGRAQIGRGITTVPSLSGAGINFASKLGVSIILWLGNSVATDNLNIFRLRFGSDNTPVADGVDAVAYRGFGVEIKARGTSHDWRVYGHNGTSITYSAWSNTGLTANLLQTRIFLSVISNGSGTITASLGVNGSRTLSTITTTGGATTSGTSAQTFIEAHVANSASGVTTLSAALYDAMFYAQT